uniref:Transthyretin-like family protein n=1 Tax=Panagrellus redivivus TaxID=6233 RepID=A0A7E4WCN1_PANRE
MSNLKLTLLALFAACVVGAEIGLRSAGIRGTLQCGGKAVTDAHIRLLRIPLNDKKAKEADFAKEALDIRTTGPSGMFEVTGNTNGRALNETTLEPAIAIYHKCDDGEKEKGYRRVVITAPKNAVSPGRTSRKLHDVGHLNLQIVFPGEKRDKDFKPTL